MRVRESVISGQAEVEYRTRQQKNDQAVLFPFEKGVVQMLLFTYSDLIQTGMLILTFAVFLYEIYSDHIKRK